MGTEIQLTVGKVSLSYSKNHIGIDYGFLFQDGDEARRQSDAINYEYYEEHPDEKECLADHEATFVSSLSRVVSRLSLLGHSIDSARAEYQALCDSANEMMEDDDSAEKITLQHKKASQLTWL